MGGCSSRLWPRLRAQTRHPTVQKLVRVLRPQLDHDIVETRNILVGNMKRNDPVTRRFIRYLLMRAGEALVMVRDGKKGRIITAPPNDELWTFIRKRGLGRPTKDEWENALLMGPYKVDRYTT